jgi:hypothetical protein
MTPRTDVVVLFARNPNQNQNNKNHFPLAHPVAGGTAHFVEAADRLDLA